MPIRQRLDDGDCSQINLAAIFSYIAQKGGACSAEASAFPHDLESSLPSLRPLSLRRYCTIHCKGSSITRQRSLSWTIRNVCGPVIEQTLTFYGLDGYRTAH